MFGIWPVTSCLNSSANIVDSLLSKSIDPRTSPFENALWNGCVGAGDSAEDGLRVIFTECCCTLNDPSGHRISPTTLDDDDAPFDTWLVPIWWDMFIKLLWIKLVDGDVVDGKDELLLPLMTTAE